MDGRGHEYVPAVTGVSIDTPGLIRSTFRIDGTFSVGATALGEFVARVSFFAGSATTRLALTHPRPAPGDTPGQPVGSRRSRSHIHTRPRLAGEPQGVRRPSDGLVRRDRGALHRGRRPGPRDLSGLQRRTQLAWPKSRQPRQRATTSFRGYRIPAGDLSAEGHRAQPLVSGVFSENLGITATVQDFWQNFPKGIEVSGSSLIIRLFPHQYADVHELQGGEQKTHVIFLSTLRSHDYLLRAAWVRAPLVPRATPEWYSASRAIPYLTPRSEDPSKEYLSLVDAAVEGPASLRAQARDHRRIWLAELRGHLRGPRAVSTTRAHPARLALQQPVRRDRWIRMPVLRTGTSLVAHDERARLHVVDIDIYHTI